MTLEEWLHPETWTDAQWAAYKAAYPLPWCEAVDMPYHKVSMIWRVYREGWSEFCKNKTMAEIIPEIDRIIAEAQT